MGPIYPQKTQNIAKNQNFPRNYSLSTIKLRKSQVPHKSENSYIINNQKKNFGGSQNGHKLAPGTCPKGQHKFSYSLYHPHFSIVYEYTKVNLWVFAVLDFIREIPLIFLGLCPNWAQFWDFLGNNSRKKNVRLS